jgi:pilus assembly protein Flp/PilA
VSERRVPAGLDKISSSILRSVVMSQAWNLVRKLGKDEEGAALIEYTVLLGILVVAVIATIVAVGTWVNGKWTALNGSLPAAAAP